LNEKEKMKPQDFDLIIKSLEKERDELTQWIANSVKYNSPTARDEDRLKDLKQEIMDIKSAKEQVYPRKRRNKNDVD